MIRMMIRNGGESLQYLLATAERPDLMGGSDRVVQVLKKTHDPI